LHVCRVGIFLTTVISVALKLNLSKNCRDAANVVEVVVANEKIVDVPDSFAQGKPGERFLPHVQGAGLPAGLLCRKRVSVVVSVRFSLFCAWLLVLACGARDTNIGKAA